MVSPLVLLSVCVLCLSSVGKINGQSNDTFSNASSDPVRVQQRDHILHNEVFQKLQHPHQKSHEKKQDTNHFYHALGANQARHHNSLKARTLGNQSTCANFCLDARLAAVVGWLNGSKELDIIYRLIPPSLNLTTNETFSNSTNFTLPWINPGWYNASSEYPIFSYFAKIFAVFLSSERGIEGIFNRYPSFTYIWKEVIIGFSSGTNASSPSNNKTDVFIGNLKRLFGCNGTFGENLFNVSYWKGFIQWNATNPFGGAKKVIEQGFQSIVNLTESLGRHHGKDFHQEKNRQH